MLVEDPTLPTLPHLTGPGAFPIVQAAVTAMGGQLHDVAVRQVQYRPGVDVVVRLRADVTWADGRRRADETILGAARRDGPLPGTVPVVAGDDDQALVVDLWRWPFDPVVPGIAAATTPGELDDLVAPHVGPRPARTVIAYRPTERAVVRVDGAEGRTVYLKAVPPAELQRIVGHHRRLGAAGLPVPEVLATDGDRGLLVLEELRGPTLRELIKSGADAWVDPAALVEVTDRIADLPADGLPSRQGRVADALGHAELLRRVRPGGQDRLDGVVRVLEAEVEAVAARRGQAVHGDLHEGQLVVADGAVTGLLDIDDIGAGDPVDDHATTIGHLRFRRLLDPAGPGAGTHERLGRLVADLEELATERHGSHAVATTTAAVLVGLATGPFRIQKPDWESTVDRVLAEAESLLADEGLLRQGSRSFHPRPASWGSSSPSPRDREDLT